MSGTPHARPVLITDAVEWRRLYEDEELSLRQIADRYDRPRATVQNVLVKRGVKMRPRGSGRTTMVLSDEQINEAVSLYRQGLPIVEVAAALGLSKSQVRYRLWHAGALRTPSEALILSSRTRRLPREVEDAIIDRYLAGGTCISVSRELGIGHGSVSAVLARRGVKARHVKKQTLRRAQVPKPRRIDLERIGFVPAAPLAAAVTRFIALSDQDTEDVCKRAGIDDRVLRSWRNSEYGNARFDVADRVLVGLDFLWWEVYDPQRFPGIFSDRQRDDVLAWLDAVDTAALMWEGEPCFGDAPKPELSVAA